MALYLPNTDSLLLLTPKAGSVWLRAAIKSAGVYFVQLGPQSLKGHGYLSLYGREFRNIGAFVRHPVAWHASYWGYRNSPESAWDSRWQIDRLCQSAEFPDYISKVSALLPGFTATLFSRFIGPEGDPISFVGKQENLREDLARFLDTCGEEYDKDALQTLTPQNAGSVRPEISKSVREQIVEAEMETIRRYDYSRIPNG